MLEGGRLSKVERQSKVRSETVESGACDWAAPKAVGGTVGQRNGQSGVAIINRHTVFLFINKNLMIYISSDNSCQYMSTCNADYAA